VVSHLEAVVKFEMRDDFDAWVRTGLCPFYYHRDMPRCVITRLALTARDIFDDETERAEVSSHDCLGRIPDSCPWIASLWKAPGDVDPEPEVSGIDVEFVEADPSNDACDVIVFPTTRMGRFDSLGQQLGWSDETVSAVMGQVGMFELPLESARAIVTMVPGTGYSFAIHVPIFDDVFSSGISMDALSHAMEIADDAGVRSIEVRPMCIVAPTGTVPSFDRAVAEVVSSIEASRASGGLASLSFVRFVTP
jgi:hypothetical protein